MINVLTTTKPPYTPIPLIPDYQGGTPLPTTPQDPTKPLPTDPQRFPNGTAPNFLPWPLEKPQVYDPLASRWGLN